MFEPNEAYLASNRELAYDTLQSHKEVRIDYNKACIRLNHYVSTLIENGFTTEAKTLKDELVQKLCT